MLPYVAIIVAVLTALCCIPCCNMFQLEGYKARGYIKWLISRGVRLLWLAVAAVFSAVGLSLFSNADDTIRIVLCSGFVLIGAIFFIIFIRKIRPIDVKKPLVYTARVKRLLITTLVFLVGISFLPSLTPVLIGLVVLAAPLMIVAANFVNTPIEKAIAHHYLMDAKKKLMGYPDLIKIGVTGSYGKTSTKFILGTILEQKFKVLVPPSSYNTPMGLTRVIRESLDDSHEVMIAEMGARHVGDIAELTELVHPQYGIITSVGPQHLETFGNIGNVANTKYELIESLPEDGFAFFCNDGALCRKLYDRTSSNKVLFALADEEDEWDVGAYDIECGPFGSRFTLCFKDVKSPEITEVTKVDVKTKLLGKHNILNITGCAAIAHILGLSPQEIALGISKVEPVESRLQLMPSSNGITVINDAFNSNPEGARMAMEVLRQFPGRKFVVTPGMVELGIAENELHEIFGTQIALAADFVYLVGEKHTRAIYKGISESGFNMNNVFVVHTLAEASAAMGQLLQAGDVVIFENDLPDNYTE